MLQIMRCYINIFIILLFTSCSLTPRHIASKEEIESKEEKLYRMIIGLNKTIDKKEARDLAKKSILYAIRLAKEYKVVSPPLWHNTLVNIGFKKRGLCYQWAEDMLLFLLKQKYQTVQFYSIGAKIRDYFEHNALALSAKGVFFNKSIVLDAWRESGNLYFNYIDKDKYIWKNREKVYRKVVRRLLKK